MIRLLLLTTIIFICLKLGGAVAWSWWLVFTPSLVGAGWLVSAYVGVVVLAYRLYKKELELKAAKKHAKNKGK